MNNYLMRLSILCVGFSMLIACGGKTQSYSDSETCTPWTRDTTLQAGKADKAGQLAGSAMSDDGTLIVLKNDWPIGGCSILESRGGAWNDSGQTRFASCLRATAGSDGSISVLAQTDDFSSMILERTPEGTWREFSGPEDLTVMASIHDTDGTRVLAVVSPLSLNGETENTLILGLTEHGWLQESVDLQDTYQLSSFGYLNGRLAATGMATDADGNMRALILVKQESVWRETSFPRHEGTITSLVSRDTEALAVAVDKEHGTTIFHTHDSGASWSAVQSHASTGSAGLLLEDSLLLAQTPESPNGGLWISGREPVQFTRISGQGEADTTMPEGVVGIPLSISESSLGLALTTTQGVYFSECR